MAENQLDSLEVDGPITFRILNVFALDFIEARRWIDGRPASVAA